MIENSINTPKPKSILIKDYEKLSENFVSLKNIFVDIFEKYENPTQSFSCIYSKMCEYNNITFRKKKDNFLYFNINHSIQIKVKNLKMIQMCSKFINKNIKIENRIVSPGFNDKETLNTIYLNIKTKNCNIDNKCIEIFKTYLTKGVVKKQMVNGKTISSLKLLASACHLKELAFDCESFLEKDRQLKSDRNTTTGVRRRFTI